MSIRSASASVCLTLSQLDSNTRPLTPLTPRYPPPPRASFSLPTHPLAYPNNHFLDPPSLQDRSTSHPTLSLQILPTTASSTAPIPRGTVPRPRPMSLPPPTYSPSHSGTSSDRPRQYAEQPHAAAQRQSQRGVDPTRSRTTNRILGDYTLSKTLGAGSMGKVKLAHHNVTGEKVCPPFILSSYQRFCQCRSVFSFSTPSLLIFDIHHCVACGVSPLTTVTVVRPCVSPV